MDNIIEHVIEQVAFDGSFGASIERLWTFVEAFYYKQGIQQNLDTPFKDYLWSLFIKCSEFIVVAEAVGGNDSIILSGTGQVTKLSDLRALLNEYGSRLRICTTERKQWYALTDHDVDHKQIPQMAFALMSVISRHRVNGISLPDLCRESGQDKRSAPKRCKFLADLDLVKGIPILSQRAQTTLYVHRCFMKENMELRETRGDFGQNMDELDLHTLRVAISTTLAASTSQIMALEDLRRSLKMVQTSTDQYARRRFSKELSRMAAAGYIRKVRVPGKQSGKFITCVELLREFKETDEYFRSREITRYDIDSPIDEIDHDLEVLEENKSEPEDLDLSMMSPSAAQPSLTPSLMRRDLSLELLLQQEIVRSGTKGMVAQEITSLTIGPHWRRPLDEVLKRMTPPADLSQQPSAYIGLALSSPLEETLGKIRQYRYFSLEHSSFGMNVSERADGLLTPVDLRCIGLGVLRNPLEGTVERVNRTLKSPETVQHGSSCQESQIANTKTLIDVTDLQQNNPTMMPSVKITRKRGRPSKAAVAQREREEAESKATASAAQTAAALIELGSSRSNLQTENLDKADLHGSQSPSSSATPQAREPLSFDHKQVSPMTEKETHHPVKRPKLSHTPTATESSPETNISIAAGNSSSLSMSKSLKSEPANATATSLIRSIPGRMAERRKDDPKTVTYRAIARTGALSHTTTLRKNLLLQLIVSKGGIVVFDQRLMHDYDVLYHCTTSNTQEVDRKTLRKTLVGLHSQGEVDARTVMVTSASGVHMRKDVVFLSRYDPNGSEVEAYIQDLKETEQTKRRVLGRPSITLETIARPEMDITPTVLEARKRLQQLAGLNGTNASGLRLDEGDIRKLKIRLNSQNDMSDHTDFEQLVWFKDRQALPTLTEIRDQREQMKIAEKARKKKEAEARNRSAPKKPKLIGLKQRQRFGRDNAITKYDHDPTTMPPPSLREASLHGGTMAPKSTTDSEKLETRNLEKSKQIKRHKIGQNLGAATFGKRVQASSDLEPKTKLTSKRADRFEEEDDLQQDDLPGESAPSTRMHYGFSEEQDDILVRAAALSMLFFSKSDATLKIDWSLVELCLPEWDLQILKRRYVSIRSRPQHKSKHRFIISVSFVTLYNESVRDGKLPAIPRTSTTSEGRVLDLGEYIDFSRRFDPDLKYSVNDSIPSTWEQFHNEYEFTAQSRAEGSSIWLDDIFLDASGFNRREILRTNAFSYAELEPSRKVDKNGHIKSAIKAHLLTSDADFDVAIGKKFLARFGEPVKTESVLREMLDSGTVVNSVKGDSNRITPGRNLQMSDKFFIRLRSSIGSRLLAQANAFDESMRDECTRGKNVLYPSMATNGTSAATVELAVRNNVRLQPGQRNWKEYGVIQGYSVRKIDPALLDFNIVIGRGSKEWISKASVERDSTDFPQVPEEPLFWVDIHGKVMKSVYGRLLALVATFIIQRGALCEVEFQRYSEMILCPHELQACLKDLVARKICEVDRLGMYRLCDHYYRAFK